MVDFLDEVKEDLRRDQRRQFAKKYGPAFVAAVAVALLGAGGYSWYESNKIAKQEKSGDKFFAAIGKEEEMLKPAAVLPKPGEATPPIPAEKRLSVADEFEKVVGDGVKGYEQLAELRRAALLAEAGKQDEAIKLYDSISGDSSQDTAIRDLASLQAVTLLIDSPNKDAKVDEEIERRLSDLSGEMRPWRYSAREMQAFRTLKDGDDKKALALFESLLQDAKLPDGMRERSTRVVAILKRDPVSDIAPAAGSPSAPATNVPAKAE